MTRSTNGHPNNPNPSATAEMLSIGEFATEVGLSVSAVRFYGDRGLVEPPYVDATSGYRFYVPSQVEVGRLVRDLRLIGLSLVDIEIALSADESTQRQLIAEHLATREASLRRARTVADSLAERASGSRPRSAGRELGWGELMNALAQVLPSVGSDPQAPHLMTVLIEAKHDSLRLVASDRFRLAVRDLVCSGGESFTVVVAAASLARWSELARDVDDSAQVTLCVVGQELAVTGDGIDLRAPIVPTTFPDYESVLSLASVASSTSVVADRADLLAGLESCSQDAQLIMRVEDGRVVFEQRETLHEFDVLATGRSVEVVLNPGFAGDCVRNAVGDEIVIDIDDPLEPVAFRSADDGAYTALLMPIKR